MSHTRVIIAAAALTFILGCLHEQVRKTEDVPRITKEQFRSILGSRDVVIMDVRTQKQWSYSDRKIPGAVYENPDDVGSWADKYPKGKTLVLY
jgi:3-mercaptopyruvate sulfurtransferase SseA